MTTRAVLLRLLLLGTSCHLTLSLGYPSPCDGPARPNDLGSGPDHGPGRPGRRPTVAFLLTGGIPSSQPGLLGFRRTVTNVNARIQQEFGSFIAQTPGLYVFTFTAVSDSNSHFRIALRRNKQTVLTAFAERHGYQSASQTAVIELSVDDIVYLQVEEGCIFESSTPDQTYTSFGGFLLAPSTDSWGEAESSPSPPGVLKATPPYLAGLAAWPGAVGGTPPPGGFRWPSTEEALTPGAIRPAVTPGGGYQDILPPGLPRPQTIPGGGGQDILPPGVPRPVVVPGTGGQVIPPARGPHPAIIPGVGDQDVPQLGVLLAEGEAEDISSAGSGEPLLTGSRPPSVRRLIPRPPHTDISDLAERAPEQPMRFPDGDVTPPRCCDG